MGILNFFKKNEMRSFEEGSWIPDGYYDVKYAGYHIRPETVEALSAVYGCVQAISSAISSLPMYLYRTRGKQREEVTDGAFIRLLKRGPNQYQTMPEFLEMLTAQLLLTGNALVDVEISKNGNIESMRVIPWQWVNPQLLPNGHLAFDVYVAPSIWTAQPKYKKRLLQSESILIRDRSDDGLLGVSRLQRARNTFVAARTVNDYAVKSFENGLRPSVVLKTEAKTSPEVKKSLRDNLKLAFAGPNKAANAIVLDNGLDLTSLPSISPEDAELLESRKWSTEEICRIFQVPPPIIQDYAHNTFTNSAAAGRWFAQFCLLPLVRKIEAAFNGFFWPSGKCELSLDLSVFDRGDPSTRWQNHQIAVSNGILSVDEVREIEGYSPKKA